MAKLFIAACVLLCGLAGQASAQSQSGSDGAGSGAAPPIILPGMLTSPITSGLGSDGDRSTSAPTGETPGTTSEAPYSVEGEETLDPNTN